MDKSAYGGCIGAFPAAHRFTTAHRTYPTGGAMTRSVLISGGGIAGPSLAYWLGTSGYAVTVVERAPGLRTSGASAVDFRGDQLALLARMGVLGEIQASQTGMGAQAVTAATGRRRSTSPSALSTGDSEIEL